MATRAIVLARGEVDLASASELEAEVEQAWRSGAELVAADLRAVISWTPPACAYSSMRIGEPRRKVGGSRW